MQKPSVIFTQFMRTCYNYSQQQHKSFLLQLQKRSVCQQVNHVRAAAITTVAAQQQQQQSLQSNSYFNNNNNNNNANVSRCHFAFQSICSPTATIPLITTITPASTTTTSTLLNTPKHSTLLLGTLRPYSKFIAAREPTVLSGGVALLSEERAHDLISNLKDSEREAIKTALAKYDALRLKETFEGKLAATQWRTRFGRLSHMPALGEVDPTGSFCAFPDDWLKKKAAEKAKEPTRQDLMKIFFVNAVPFVGFGFLDNFTMIIAGDYIEYAFGTFMCISTMAAAGLGNTISDILGIGSAYYVERGCELLGLRPPDLTPVQMEMKSSRRSANYGRIIGITVGCLVGMFPLMFMEKKPKEGAEDDKNKKSNIKTNT